MAFLDCSDHWSIDIAEGIQLQRVNKDALTPTGNQGEILLAARAGEGGLVMNKNFATHEASIELAPKGEGHLELLLRLAPGIALSSEEGKIHLDAGTKDKNIVIFERVPVSIPSETIFIVTPIPPNNLDGTILPAQLTAFPPNSAASSVASPPEGIFLDCSDQWRIEVEEGSGIELRKLKQGALPAGDKGEIISAKVRNPAGSAAGKRLALRAESKDHTATISGTLENDPSSEWLLRVADGITISKDKPDDQGARLKTEKPKDIVASPLEAPAEIAFVHSQVPKIIKRPDIKEADMESIT